MNIIVCTNRRGSYQINLGRPGVLALCAIAFTIALSSVFAGGYFLATEVIRPEPSEQIQRLQARVETQAQEIREAKRTARENLNALGVRLGQLNAHVIRLDALGQRLTSMAGLEQGEFDFENLPAQGGPEVLENTADTSVNDFLEMMDEVSAQIDDRQQQLAVLEHMLMNRNLQEQVHPAGRPITKGWLSSHYGTRTDPFTGKRAWHGGIDFAGREGSEIVAVAAGVVAWAGPRWGYGKLVEINHGNGYTTRYGHNKEIKVEVGDTVKKGQVISEMGSSGRSTGPHVHFEVLYNGKPVNPKQYIQASS